MHKFACLRGADQALVLRALLLVGTIRLGLWVLPFRILREWAARTSTARRGFFPRHSIASISQSVEAVAHYVPAATCLTQALATQILIAREAGVHSTLRIGVLRADGRFKAHAWVECEGRIIIGAVAGIEEFKRLPIA